MFNHKEASFLAKELKQFIKRIQTKLADPTVEGTVRERLEDRLITTVSIVNKVAHLEPDQGVSKGDAKLLIVDDVESMRKVHRHYFMAVGFKKVDLAADGKHALSLMHSAADKGSPYDLVISDWEMPKMSGTELLKAVRMDDALWRTPFYLISSNSDKKQIMNAINLGATGYLVKPVNQKTVQDKFAGYL